MKLSGKIAEANIEVLNGKRSLAPHQPPRVWVLAADRRTARIFHKTPEGLELLGEALSTGSGRAKLSNDSIGNVTASSGGSLHHQYEPHMESSRHDEMLFVRELAQWLDEAAARDSFDRLVLAAPPQMLGYLRKGLGKHVLERVMADVNKDLVKMDGKEMRQELAGIIVF